MTLFGVKTFRLTLDPSYTIKIGKSNLNQVGFESNNILLLTGKQFTIDVGSDSPLPGLDSTVQQ